MRLKQLNISGFKSFAKPATFSFDAPISAIVGPNGSGKSNVAEAIRFVLGEQSMKSMRGKRGEDMIWNGSGSMPRANKASVEIVFDNRDRAFDMDYDEVAIKRQVFRDGTNEYSINGSVVRLRDVYELLAHVHIGASDHHIISQGEADRILNSNIKERRAMVEDALGIKIYHWKIEESEKKLGKTEENMKEVNSLRREIAPHLKFLKRQVEKVEKAQEMQEDLQEKYTEYLAREDAYLKGTREWLEAEKKEPERELQKVEGELEDARRTLEESKEDNPEREELIGVERKLREAQAKKDELAREVGRVEGMFEYEKKRVEKERDSASAASTVAFGEVKTFTDDVREKLGLAREAGTIEQVRSVLARIEETLSGFLRRVQKGGEESGVDTGELDELTKKKEAIDAELEEAEKRAKELQKEYEQIREKIEKEKDTSRAAERTLFMCQARKTELTAKLNELHAKEEQVERDKRAFEEEIQEGMVLVGSGIGSYKSNSIDENQALGEPREKQEGRRKEIEKIKIKLEDAGITNTAEIMNEYKEVGERDEFLARELLDLEKSAESLRGLIAELNERLDREFKEGVVKINEQFQEFFAILFGGGTAKLHVVAQKKRKPRDIDVALSQDDEAAFRQAQEQEEEGEEGIDISVSLPRKKIKGLTMLSGGERALTSIALIFAVSQVNPPPFLVLDETDAALDEANSRRYGEMLMSLSKHSQLVVVTHNRETMSRAGVLYGVTMGSDAVSRLLSVKFDEAAQYAK